ncbi:hypothetical protein K2173_002240 [Erythroxylum novogranatense]|uniref:Nucleolar pre-ribosomal-associated protein 1 n=1 Tax=Erythroxylum novogranatense TaxID=1862640 RepID=A0AAV8T958_9ROSI|nr:hypothetical protein K2173_002240 [Erythroxylum novogranatense]
MRQISNDPAVLEDDDEGEKVASFGFETTYEAKLREILHKINSVEIKLCSDATKEFIKLLRGNAGRALLYQYVQMSSNFSELMGPWKLRIGKPGMSYIQSLVSAILSHSDGKYQPDDKKRIAVSRVLDKFARMLVAEKLEDICKELSSKEGKRQNAALLLMTSIVRRGSGLASEVAKTFNFKLQGFSKLAEHKRRQNEKERKHSTRKAFVGFAMSFLEVGKPGLLKWILQQKEIYSGVLRGLGSDDEETVIYVLSTLKEKVLTPESLVPPGLRSVLFGSVTLEQLVGISAWENGGPAADLAHSVLKVVCTDPCNGLMPDLKRHSNPLKGNAKRLLVLMKKLKATEIAYHRDLLSAIIVGRPSFGSAYMEEFPYNLEDYASPNWFATISLAAYLVSSVGVGLRINFLSSETHESPSVDDIEVQNVINCISPCPFGRSVINRGLLHSHFLVKNGMLRLLLEMLNLFASFLRAIDLSCSREQRKEKWRYLKQEIQNEIRTRLPDPQVLLNLLSSLSSDNRTYYPCLKRMADKENLNDCHSNKSKRLKSSFVNGSTDIVVGGMCSELDSVWPGDTEKIVDTNMTDETDVDKDFTNSLSDIWDSDLTSVPVSTLMDAEMFFHSKLLDALKIYLLTMPFVLEGSFDFFINLLNNPLAFPIYLQDSLLSLLVEYIKWSPSSGQAIRIPPSMYKHLQPFIKLLIFSSIDDIKVKAYDLARAAMLSTGAFDRNFHEIGAWLLYLPGYDVKSSLEAQETEVLLNFSPVAISFLCDAVSTVGNNLFKYWNILRNHVYNLEDFKDVSPEFSPLIICVLQKCLRLLKSESGTFTLPEKSMISLYVSNTLTYLLQIQKDAGLLAALVRLILFEELKQQISRANGSIGLLCEWKPLQNLLLFAERILDQKTWSFVLVEQQATTVGSSFKLMLGEVKRNIVCDYDGERTGITKAFCSALICATSEEVLENFPLVMEIYLQLRVPISLSSIVSYDQNFLAGVLRLWPKVFFSGLEMAVSMYNPQGKNVDILAKDEDPNTQFGESAAAAAAAFGVFLRQVPFHALFPGIVGTYIPTSSDGSKIRDLLVAKLSECKSDILIAYLHLILFWFHQIRSNYESKQLAEPSQLAEICYIFVKVLLAQLLAAKPDSEPPMSTNFHPSAGSILPVVETIFCHPTVTASLAFPLSCDKVFKQENFWDSLKKIIVVARQRVHRIDHLLLNMLKVSFDHLLSSSNETLSILEVKNNANKQFLTAINSFTEKLILILKEKINLCFRTDDLSPLLPSFNALHTLIQFVSPFDLLQLVHWIFGKVDLNELTDRESCWLPLLSVGFCIAGDAFKNLCTFLQQSVTKKVPFYWTMEEQSFDFDVVEEIYLFVCKLAVKFELDSAYSCLLDAINAVYILKVMQQGMLHPLSLVLSRVITGTPLEILSYCMSRTSMTKAKLLFLLVESSPLHLSVFGKIYLNCLNKDSQLKSKVIEEHCALTLSPEDSMMLLPAALSYMNSIFTSWEKEQYLHFEVIPSFYSKLILNSFHHWESFGSKFVLQEVGDRFFPSSVEELTVLVNNSLLGKAVRMLQYHFVFNGHKKVKQRLKLFNSHFERFLVQDNLLDCDSEMENYSVNQSVELINRVIAKISFCQLLLFPETDQVLSVPKETDGKLEFSFEELSDEEIQCRLHLINVLVGTWQSVVKKFLYTLEDRRSEKNCSCLQLYRYFELFILRTILELVTKIRDGLTESHSISFLEQLIRSSLLYRFDDPETLKILRTIVASLSDGKFPFSLYLHLLIAHSQFASSIRAIAKPFTSQTGAFVRPMSSILRSLAICRPGNNLQMCELDLKLLEIVKLLRLLLHLTFNQSGSSSGRDIDINLKELYLLLLSSYGGTLTEIDLELYHVMLEIESIDTSISEVLADLDYLWGTAAWKIRQEWALDRDTSDIMTDTEAVEERRRIQFRDNFPIDPKVCVRTMLNFPYDRTVNGDLPFLNGPQHHEFGECCERHGHLYDPVFILRFAIHTLPKNYVEAVEYAALGVLALAFINISSLDVGMRKLGYEFLSRYKDAIEKGPKKKDIMRLSLLLTYVQNGIEEPWQRIPSVMTIFAAESSFILLDPSHDHYATLNKHLLHSYRMSLKGIPLFHIILKSNSINFKTETLWMLRLACAGLNLDDDARIYIRNSAVETLLSFYFSFLSDNESKELILETVQKSVKLHKMARYLVEKCGLFQWLASVISMSSKMLNGSENIFYSQHLAVAIKVVADAVSSRNINEWLQSYALEQLMGLVSHLFRLLFDGLKLSNEDVGLADVLLQIIMSTLKISQKRKIYQSHYTVSIAGLFKIYQACDVPNAASSYFSAESGLKTILMSTPPVDILCENEEKLSNFLMWSVSTALVSDSRLESRFDSLFLQESAAEESLKSKLLRWLVASVILGMLSSNVGSVNVKISKGSNSRHLDFLLENLEVGRESSESRSHGEGILACTILYIQQLLGMDHPVVPSAVSALCLLLFSDASKYPDFKPCYRNLMVSLSSKVGYPPEANPGWRWSFYQPWKDLSSNFIDSEKLDQRHACETLLVIIANILGSKPLDSQLLTPQDIEKSGIFEWERSIIESGS